MVAHQDDDPEPFRCHPNCTWDYMRRVAARIETEDSVGLSIGQMVDLVLAVDQAEREEWRRDRPATETGRKTAVNLALRGLAPSAVDVLFGFNPGTTDRLLEAARLHPRTREVIAAHVGGDSASKIGRDLGLARSTIELILRYIGEEPRAIRNMARSADINHAVIRLYLDLRRSGSKNIYHQIAQRLDISETNVRARLQYARKQGKLTDPPLARSNVKRRRPRAAE